MCSWETRDHNLFVALSCVPRRQREKRTKANLFQRGFERDAGVVTQRDRKNTQSRVCVCGCARITRHVPSHVCEKLSADRFLLVEQDAAPVAPKVRRGY